MSRSGMKKKNKNRVVAYGFVGEWADGTLGWFLPAHLVHSHKSRRYANGPAKHPNWSNIGATSYLCKITLERVKAKNGRAITRKVRNP